MTRETTLGPPVIAWLHERHWEVYQEVTAGMSVADIVATCGPLVATVELKVNLTFDLLAQAARWRWDAHMVWVAVPWARADRRMAERVFADHGIGLLVVEEGKVASERHPPALNRKADAARLRGFLRPEHQTFAAAGTSTGERWTTFKSTCAELLRHVTAHPGALMNDALKSIQHHYASASSARAHLSKLIEKGVVKGIRLERDGRRLRLHPT